MRPRSFPFSRLPVVLSIRQTLFAPAQIQNKLRYLAEDSRLSPCGCVPVSVADDSLRAYHGRRILYAEGDV